MIPANSVVRDVLWSMRDLIFGAGGSGRIAPTRALFVVTPSPFVSMVRRARVDLSDNPVFVEPDGMGQPVLLQQVAEAQNQVANQQALAG